MSSQTYSADATHVLYLDQHLSVCLLLADAMHQGFQPEQPIIDLLKEWHDREDPDQDLADLGYEVIGQGEDPDILHYTYECLQGDNAVPGKPKLDLCGYLPSFAGTVSTVYPDHAKGTVSYDLDDDDICVIYPKGDPDLFKAPYSKPEDIIDEFKKALSKFLDILPEGVADAIDWWGLMVDLDGTTFS